MKEVVSFEVAAGVRLYPSWLDKLEQAELLSEIGGVLGRAPLYRARMPRSGAPMSVLMTNCGELGWYSDEGGYRYIDRHPGTGLPWPPIPRTALRTWRALSNWADEPEACLVNFYDPAASMGLHQDRDEEDLEAPVVSLSLGYEATFRLGGLSRRDPTKSFRLRSGDALVLGGPARLAFHGIDRIRPSPSPLDMPPGRYNLTLRRVSRGTRIG